MVDAMVKEIELRKDYLQNENITSVYFGGGTPSMLSTSQLDQLLNTIYRHFIVTKQAEITLEANPDDLSKEKISEIKKTTVNRFSIGIQSFFDEDLQWMNRAHSADQAKECIVNAKEAGFDNLTIDLIYGMPSLSNEKWMSNIEAALSFGIDHISAYALTVEAKTALDHLIRKKKVSPVNDEQSAQQFEILMDKLGENKFEQYEISNFARKKKYAIHNTAYWKNEMYLGIGPSAHSFNKIARSWNIANNNQYLHAINSNSDFYETEILTTENRCNEYVMTGLRTMWGCDIRYIETEFGKQFAENIRFKLKQQPNELVEMSETVFKLTTKGRLFADRIAGELFM